MIDKYREEIDLIDGKIIELLIKRFQIVLDIKEYKENHNLPILDTNREQAIISKINNLNFDDNIIEIYKVIMQESKKIQKGE